MSRRHLINATQVCLLALAAMLLVSCSTTMSKTTDENSAGTSFALHGSDADAKLSQARQLRMDGEFDEAATLLLDVYENLDNASDDRAQALYDLSAGYSNLLNLGRDYEMARGYLEVLLAEFPDSELRKQATQQLEHLDEIEASTPQQ